MKKLILLMILMLTPCVVHAQELTSNTWASWVNVTSTQTDWVFPYSSRSITLINGSTTAVCISFGRSSVITPGCSDQYSTGDNSSGNGNNNVFQLAGSTFIYLENLKRPEIHLKAIGNSTASPVSVIVNY